MGEEGRAGKPAPDGPAETDERGGAATTDYEAATTRKAPSLFRNYVSLAGAAVAAAGFVSIALMLMLELLGGADEGKNPYIGIFTYILFPSVMGFGLFVAFAGALWESRRRRRLSPEEIGRFPVLDLNDPRRRRSLEVFMLCAFIFLFMSAFGSYRAFEHTESVQFCGQTCHTVMKPEFTAYQASPHARVRCVECHVGPGAGWYVRSKLSGAYQLYSVAFNKYPRPIKSPVHNLRPAPETCEQCHWPQKFYGAQLKVFNHYGYDEKNSPSQERILINVGGGDPRSGVVEGIHWHMNIANEITYVSTDEQRQVIPWVRIKDRQGNVTEYTAKNNTLSSQQLAAIPSRRMDCVDCHNRPSHVYVPPDRAVNDAFFAGRLDESLPYLKRQAVEVLTKQYGSTDEALKGISEGLDNFYRANYADVYAQKPDSIRRAVAETQRIYQTYFFPEMRVDYRTHPDNIGHYYSTGCFRCHDGQHYSTDGRVIRNDCNICHTTLSQTRWGQTTQPADGSFKHPVDLGNLSGISCNACHKGGQGFQHPVNLGDLSQFKCADCHAGKDWMKDGH